MKDKQKKIEKFVNKIEADKETGDVPDTHTHLSLNMDKIREYIDLPGYYTIMTLEIEKPDREVINKHHGLSRI